MKPALLRTTLKELIPKYEHFLFDCDGVLVFLIGYSIKSGKEKLIFYHMRLTV